MTFLFRLLARLPLSVAHVVGAALGALVYVLAGSERRRVQTHLALAYPQGVPPKLAWRAALSAGRAMTELPYLWQRSLPEVLARVESVEGWDAVQDALDAGHAPLFLTPHMGSFEIVGQWLASRVPIVCLYRRPKNAGIESVMVAGRSKGQMSVAPADVGGVKTLLKTLKRGDAVGILPDQVPQSGEGIWVPFFGKPAYTMTLGARFSALPKVETFMVVAERLSGGRYRIIIERPSFPQGGAVEARTEAINREVERLVKRFPEQYFWGYNRYKTPHAEAAMKAASLGDKAET